jgi:hypothetical protein
MRVDLWDDPRVLKLCNELDIAEATAIGGLYRLWSLADSHSTDGILPGYSTAIIDKRTGIPGFSVALVKVDWLDLGDNGAVIPEFEIHNGSSAKRRAQAAVRKQRERAGLVSRSERDTNATREE